MGFSFLHVNMFTAFSVTVKNMLLSHICNNKMLLPLGNYQNSH